MVSLGYGFYPVCTALNMRAANLSNRFFLQYKIHNCPNNRTISQDICTRFVRHLCFTLCSWMIRGYFVLKTNLFDRLAALMFSGDRNANYDCKVTTCYLC